MDFRTYQYLRDNCMGDLRVYIETPEHNAALRLRINLANGTIGKIEHEYQMALSLFQCDDLTPHGRAAAHLLAVISNHRAITHGKGSRNHPMATNPHHPWKKQK